MSVSPLSQPGNNAIKPDAPTGQSAAAVGGGGATVSFTPSTNPGKGSANYVATSSPGSITASAASSPITFGAGVLTAGTSYTFTIVKQSGSGVNSDTSSATNSITAFYAPLATTGSGSDTTSTPSAPTTNSATNLETFSTVHTETFNTPGSGTWTNNYPFGATAGIATLNGSSGTTSFIWGTSSGSYPNEVSATSNAYAGTTWSRGATIYYKAKITNTSCAMSLTGTVNARGASTTVTFEYGTSPGSYTQSVSAGTVTGASSQAVNASVSSLGAGTYYFRVKAVNAGGTTYGSEGSIAISAKSSIASSEQSFSVPYVGTISNVLVVAGGGSSNGEGGGGGGVAASDSMSVGNSLSYTVGAGGPSLGGQVGGSSSLQRAGVWTMSANGGGISYFGGSYYRGGRSGAASGGTTFNSVENDGGEDDYAENGAGYGGGGGAGGAGQSGYHVDTGYTYIYYGGNGGAAVTYYGITVSSGGGGYEDYDDGIFNPGTSPTSAYGGGGQYGGGPYGSPFDTRPAQGGIVRFVWVGP